MPGRFFYAYSKILCTIVAQYCGLLYLCSIKLKTVTKMALTLKNFETTWDMFPDPCYDPQIAYGECPATMLDIINDERIPAKDRIWAFASCVEISDNIKRMAAVRFVRETPLGDGRFVSDLLTDPRSITALDVAERHANGEATDEELRASATSAASAAYDAAYAAAYAATAAYDAAYAAAASAAAASASAAARQAQIEILKSFLK